MTYIKRANDPNEINEMLMASIEYAHAAGKPASEINSPGDAAAITTPALSNTSDQANNPFLSDSSSVSSGPSDRNGRVSGTVK